ncbi:MAG: bifunctional phosphopantothenoylcysteine decarboxylase/phosphopantothenate--cysteine ligase CoaBC [Thermodesulfobacteriota bacterium]|nr:bifunctional phosphopantothenoylcysteine decarboxylase/phosphopantothenate--cysteine ligase CoaBC [Thermodesulfobacteriota bacterium]
MPEPLKDKEIILGVCGGIAAYKAPDFLRLLVKCGANVRVVMTRAAQEFVGPLTFEALSTRPVWTHLFKDRQGGALKHIQWADGADGAVIIPATANTIGKIAHGMADDPLSTLVLSLRVPILICPAMNVNMYENALVKENIERLRLAGFHFAGPETGSLACGHEGAGRLAHIEGIAEQLRTLLSPQDLTGESVLVTAGPTQEPMDPVRFIGNPSSGKMGYALARAAHRRGAQVLLISGPTVLCDPEGVSVKRVGTAKEMFETVMAHGHDKSVIIKAAAVSDWRPTRVSEGKLKKDEMGNTLSLERTPDILKALGEQKGGQQVLVGFAAETQDLLENAKAKMAEKNVDLMVANLVGTGHSGFGSETNQAHILSQDGGGEALPVMDKGDLADIILDRVLELRRGRS